MLPPGTKGLKENDDDDVGNLLDSSREFIGDLVSKKSEESNKPKKQKKANFHDQILQLQQQQVDAMKEADEKSRTFMEDLMDQHRTDYMRERNRDRYFLGTLRNCLLKTKTSHL